MVKAYTKITRKLGCLIADLARFMTLSDIAGWLRLSWDTVKATNRAGSRMRIHLGLFVLFEGKILAGRQEAKV